MSYVDPGPVPRAHAGLIRQGRIVQRSYGMTVDTTSITGPLGTFTQDGSSAPEMTKVPRLCGRPKRHGVREVFNYDDVRIDPHHPSHPRDDVVVYAWCMTSAEHCYWEVAYHQGLECGITRSHSGFKRLPSQMEAPFRSIGWAHYQANPIPHTPPFATLYART